MVSQAEATVGDELDLSPYFVEGPRLAERGQGPATFDPRLPDDLFREVRPAVVPSSEGDAVLSLSTTAGTRPAPEAGAPEPGTVIDKYRIEQLVGAGGFALVYRATHLLLHTPVALKLLRRKALKRYPRLAQAFCEEARLAARVTHPNVVRVLDVTDTPHITYLVIEFVEGGSLADLLRTRRLGAAETVRLGLDVASGLKAAWERGLVHRDVKPANILLTATGMAKVGDLGLARLEAPDADGTVFGGQGMVGTPGYMAPEQAADARTADWRADLYSLGVTLFHAAVGEPPFPLGDRRRLMELHRSAVPPRPSERAPGVPVSLESVIVRLLAKDPRQRYASYDALLDALRAAAEDLA